MEVRWRDGLSWSLGDDGRWASTVGGVDSRNGANYVFSTSYGVLDQCPDSGP